MLTYGSRCVKADRGKKSYFSNDHIGSHYYFIYSISIIVNENLIEMVTVND